MVGLITAGCGATAMGSHATPAATSAQPSVAPAANFTDLRNRPLNQPPMGADGSCPATAFHDVHAAVTSGKGAPNFGFRPGPPYLGGIIHLYPGAFHNEIRMIDASHPGPVP